MERKQNPEPACRQECRVLLAETLKDVDTRQKATHDDTVVEQ